MDAMFKRTDSLSDTNKLLIRCAYFGVTEAFGSAQPTPYDLEWAPGSCA